VRKGGLGEGVVRVENEQLREDNAKLMKMIQQTKEFQEFQGFVEDSGGNVKGVAAPVKVSAEAEQDQWMPQEAFSVAHEFRERHGNDLTPTLINQLLSDLNRIWRERERKQISRIKLQCSQEIN
jgi:hypothetical protein